MFNGLRSSSPSPCPSPVRDFVSNLKYMSSPKRDKYRTMVESKEPMISKGRLTMTGGFTDLRPRPYTMEKVDSVESDSGTSTTSSSSRSNSYDSNDTIIYPPAVKTSHRFVKIPRKALKNVIHHLSPRLSKKLMQEEKKYEEPKNPMWPNVMTTYARGINTTQVEQLVKPAQPSLTAMKARALLDDKKVIREAVKMLAEEVKKRQQQQSECSNSSRLSSDSDPGDADFHRRHTNSESLVNIEFYKPVNEIADNLLQFQIYEPERAGTDIFPINPKISVNAPDNISIDSSGDEDFLDESIFDALDLDSVPTMSPEELASSRVAEVCNVHLCREYIILETAPPTDSIFV